MADVYADDIATAIELIAEFGADCVWQKAAPVVEAEPGYPTEGVAPDPVPCKMVFFSPRDLGRGSEMFAAMMAGIEVVSNTQIGLLAGGLTFTPETTDTLTRGGVELGIKSIDLLAPNGTPVLYYVTVAA